jgi:DNA-binding CsgD family transcriptional regulator
VDEARRLDVGAFNLNRGLIGYAEAVLAGRGGEGRRADELAATAGATFVNCETWAVLARFLAAPAARADRWGRPERWLAEAAGLFPAIGLDALASRARELRKGGEPNPWADEGITDREADVLRLIGQGLANKEIAAKLGVSPRTVEKHVESLLRKTGRRTRVELALQARSTGTT